MIGTTSPGRTASDAWSSRAWRRSSASTPRSWSPGRSSISATSWVPSGRPLRVHRARPRTGRDVAPGGRLVADRRPVPARPLGRGAGRGGPGARRVAGSEVPTPGFSSHGFMSAWLISHARRDPVEADRWATVVRSIIHRLPPEDRQRRSSTSSARTRSRRARGSSRARLNSRVASTPWRRPSSTWPPGASSGRPARSSTSARIRMSGSWPERPPRRRGRSASSNTTCSALEAALAWFRAAGARPFIARVQDRARDRRRRCRADRRGHDDARGARRRAPAGACLEEGTRRGRFGGPTSA